MVILKLGDYLVCVGVLRFTELRFVVAVVNIEIISDADNWNNAAQE